MSVVQKPTVHRSRATGALAAAGGLTIALYALPYLVPGAALVAWPLVLLATLLHELGHGLTAAALGGRFEYLALYADASGVAAHTGDHSGLANALVAAAGPLGPPFAALILFVAARRDRAAHVALAISAAALALVLLLWVRNAFGVAFVAVLATLLVLLAWRGSARVAQIACCFLAIQMSLSAFARADYLFMAEAETGAGLLPSDTAQIAAALWLPYWFWGGLIAFISVLVLALGLRLFARAVR